MLTLDPNKRSTITDIINHKWFQLDGESVSLNSSFNLTSSNMGLNNTDYSIYQEFRNLIVKIEQMFVTLSFFLLKI